MRWHFINYSQALNECVYTVLHKNDNLAKFDRNPDFPFLCLIRRGMRHVEMDVETVFVSNEKN